MIRANPTSIGVTVSFRLLCRFDTPRSESTARSEIPAFFFQAEDRIRYLTVTGVQTCALPILDAVVLGGDQDAVAGDQRLGIDLAIDRDREEAGLRSCEALAWLVTCTRRIVVIGRPVRQIGRASCRGRG